MKVSIITSCFNREATIGDAIESVLSQTYPDIEYIVIDGASKDNSWAVIERYKEGIAQMVSERDRGMYEGINKGLKRATGDIIGLIHSDDFLFRRKQLRILYGSLRKRVRTWCMATDCLWMPRIHRRWYATGLAVRTAKGK